MKSYRAKEACTFQGRYYDKGQVAEFEDDVEVSRHFAPFDEAEGSGLPKNHPLLSDGEAQEIENSPVPRSKMDNIGIERADRMDVFERKAGIKPPVPPAPKGKPADDGAKKETERPSSAKAVKAAIVAEIGKLDPEQHFTTSGAPNVGVLSDNLGYPITAAERDEAWEEYQAAKK